MEITSTHLNYRSTYLFIYLPTYLPIYLSIHPSIYLSIYLSTYLSIYLSIGLSLNYPSIHLYMLPVNLSIYLPKYCLFIQTICVIHFSVSSISCILSIVSVLSLVIDLSVHLSIYSTNLSLCFNRIQFVHPIHLVYCLLVFMFHLIYLIIVFILLFSSSIKLSII